VITDCPEKILKKSDFGGHGGGKIKSKLLFSVLLLFGLALLLNITDVSATADNQTDTLNQSTGQDLGINTITQTSDQQLTTTETDSNSTEETNSNSPTETNVGPPEFTLDQITVASTYVRSYVETNHSLPDYVNIDGIYVDMPSFLKLLTSSVLEINNGTITPIDFLVYNSAPKPRDEIRNGDLSQTEYLKIAADVKSFMDRTGLAPEYAYNTSLGLYFGYQNLVYTYTMIMDSYGVNNALPSYVTLKPWKIVSDPKIVNFTVDQVSVAATWVKNYVDTNHKLPDYVTIGTTNVTMPSFLELLTTSILQINKGTDSTVDLFNFGSAPIPRDEIRSGDMSQAEYLKIANDVKSFMDAKGIAPEFAYNTSLGLYFSYQNLVYTYAKILDSYSVNTVLPKLSTQSLNAVLSVQSVNTVLPTYVSLKPWNLVVNPPVSFTLDDVTTAATWVKNYIDTNHKLPDYVTIGTTNVTMPSFLELLTTSVLKINNGTDTLVDLLNSGSAPTPKDGIRSGDMSQAEYLKIANDVKSFMDAKGIAPEFAYNTSLGLYFGYQNLVYTYAKILDSYGTNGVLPTYVSLKPWNLVVNPPVSFTLDDVTTAATWVKNYIDTNHKLPDYVTIGTTNVTMPSFLELLTTTTLQINNGTSTTVDLMNFGSAPTSRDEIRIADMNKAEYLKIAADVKSFMDTKGIAPEYAYNTSIGSYLGYQNLVYMYAKILDSYDTNGVLPASVSMKPWTTFTLDQVGSAATWVTNYVQANHKLPDSVTIGSINVNMPSFLEILTTAVLEVSNGQTTPVYFIASGGAPNPKDTITSGNIYTAEYLKIAQDVKSFMDTKGIAPEYAYNTSLGSYLGCQNLVYMYAMLMDYNHRTGNIAEYVVMKPWSAIDTSLALQYIPQIMSGAAGYGYSSGISTAAAMISAGAGDCWAMSEYLYLKFSAVNIRSRIVQYATAYSSNHRSVQIYQNGVWVDAPYREYGLNSMFNNTAASAYGTVIAGG
jgi:uncharacterized protein YpmS